MAGMFLGAAAAARDGPLAPGWLALTVLGVFSIEVAKNASGEVFDFDSGADSAVLPEDRSPFSGGKRVLVEGWLTRGRTAGLATVAYALGIAIGLAIALLRAPGVLGLGLIGVGCAYFYHAPPIKLSYRGLGEAAVALCYGPLVVIGTYLVQRGTADWRIVWLSAPLGLLIAAFLWINEFPDYRADRAAGKGTLVTRLGRPRAARAYASLLATAFLILALLPLVGVPKGVWLGGLAVPHAFASARRLLTEPERTEHVIPAQSWCLVAFLLLALGTGAGFLL